MMEKREDALHERMKVELYAYLRESGWVRECKSEYAINGGLRPDLLCEDDRYLVAEVKRTTRGLEGPPQLRAYVNELFRRGFRVRKGILAYGSVDRYDLALVSEQLDHLSLSKDLEEVEVLEYRGKGEFVRVNP